MGMGGREGGREGRRLLSTLWWGCHLTLTFGGDPEVTSSPGNHQQEAVSVAACVTCLPTPAYLSKRPAHHVFVFLSMCENPRYRHPEIHFFFKCHLFRLPLSL